MKKCRYCAEEIQDEAIICRFCGRPQTGGAADGSGRPAWLLPAGIVAALVVVAGVAALALADRQRRATVVVTPRDSVAIDSSLRAMHDSFPAFAELPGLAQREDTPAAPPPPPPPPPAPPPATDEVASFDEQKIPAGGYLYYPFEVTDGRPCRLRGRVETTAGGSHDLDVMVLDQDGWTNYRYHRAVEPVWQTRRTAAVTLDVPLPGTGTYYFVLSNGFSMFTGKVVKAENVHWVCSDELAPAPAEQDTASGAG